MAIGQNILFVIERKTWTDLASSLRDGRKENNKKLLKIREETKCQLIYLIMVCLLERQQDNWKGFDTMHLHRADGIV